MLLIDIKPAVDCEVPTDSRQTLVFKVLTQSRQNVQCEILTDSMQNYQCEVITYGKETEKYGQTVGII
jgi:hypothetical protein